jgi:hypothetical protein
MFHLSQAHPGSLSCLVIGFVTRVIRRVPQVEQALLTLPGHPSLVGFVFLNLVFCVVFCTSLFVLFHLAIVFSVLRFTDSDDPIALVSSNSSYWE